MENEYFGHDWVISFWVSGYGLGLEDGMSQERYLIWSYEHGGWWGPDRMGYVREFSKAGRYSGLEAREIILEANWYAAEQKEVMVAEEEGVRFADELRKAAQ